MRNSNTSAESPAIKRGAIAEHSPLTPALSRWEREEHPQSSHGTKRADRSEVSLAIEIVRLLFPLPAGEG